MLSYPDGGPLERTAGAGHVLQRGRRAVWAGQQGWVEVAAGLREQAGGLALLGEPPGCLLVSLCHLVLCYSLPLRAGPAGKRFAVGLSSLTGHQLAGEERFQVEMHADGSVW